MLRPHLQDEVIALPLIADTIFIAGHLLRRYHSGPYTGLVLHTAIPPPGAAHGNYPRQYGGGIILTTSAPLLGGGVCPHPNPPARRRPRAPRPFCLPPP